MSTHNSAIDRATAVGRSAFGDDWTPERIASAPGRLEVLGNHVDYSGGKVIAAAIDRSVIVLNRTTDNSGQVELAFGDFDDAKVQHLRSDDLEDWRNDAAPSEPADYLRGAIAALRTRGSIDVTVGTQLAIAGDVPIGLGLSSSAALCVALTLALSKNAFEKRDVVLIAQEAEHRAGTPCGTMDQSASVAGGFILFDSGSVTFEQLTPDLGELVFAVADSGVSRSLGTSSYPRRVHESKEGLRRAQWILDRDLSSLAELSIPDLDALAAAGESSMAPVIFRRVRHIVTENRRVRDGYEALRRGDWETFGDLMTASGRSSAIDYEISHPRVEELVAQSLDVKGVLGARMMGGGEGGTALILVRKSSVPEIERRLTDGYFAKHGMPSAVHVFDTAEGARLLKQN